MLRKYITNLTVIQETYFLIGLLEWFVLTIPYSRLAPAAAAASNPYLQQMYAAAAAAQNPYAGLQGTGLISLAQNPMAGQQAAGTTGNPLLDAYSQYAALAAQGVYTTSASATGASYTSPLDTVQAASKCFLYKSTLFREKPFIFKWFMSKSFKLFSGFSQSANLDSLKYKEQCCTL